MSRDKWADLWSSLLSRPPTGSRYWPFCSDEKVIPLLPDSHGRKGNFGLSFLALSKMALFHLIGWCHQIRIPFNYFHSPAVLCAGGGCYLQPPTLSVLQEKTFLRSHRPQGSDSICCALGSQFGPFELLGNCFNQTIQEYDKEYQPISIKLNCTGPGVR